MKIFVTGIGKAVIYRSKYYVDFSPKMSRTKWIYTNLLERDEESKSKRSVTIS